MGTTLKSEEPKRGKRASAAEVMREALGVSAKGRAPLGASRIVEITREGLKPAALNRVMKEMDIRLDDLADLLAVSKRTLERRKEEGKRLSQAESDRFVRLARVYGQAVETFESREKARRWLKKPNRALQGRAPLSLLDTDGGTRSVEDELWRIEYGEYA